jgi:uncharacterized protein (TIGR02271 family)
MTQTLAAVFDNRADAERARAELATAGFGAGNIQLSPAASPAGTGAGADSKESIGSSIKHFFTDLFSDDHGVYSEAVNRGKVVLTVQADSEAEIERAADIVNRYDPIDIDEHQDQWRASGWNAQQTQSRTGTQAQSMQSAAARQSTVQSGSQQGGTQAQSQSQSSKQYANTEAERTIPVVEEALRVGKRIVQRGGVRIFQRIVETPVRENVTLREEHVKVERHAVNQPVDPSRIDTFKEGTVELREMAEEAVVQKTARVVEEVVVGKQVSQRQDQISDKVRRTEVDIEQLGATDDDSYYRSHWTSNYASMGGAYEDYEPAYRYGSSMRSATSYQGRSWDDAETTLRRDWESRYPQSAWEKFKAAVRHGWERITS